MGKSDGFLTPKAISNRIKAKGLTKLRWYCQLCQKACRDENGYKCHTMSESHLRQVRVFSESPGSFIEYYSREFEDAFMEVLRRKGEHVRTKANSIWMEVIADRHHVHLNATRWVSLTEFVKYLGREGKAEVDEDEEGKWYVRYVNRDPEKIRRQEALAKKEKMDLDDHERAQKMVERQIKEAQKALQKKGIDSGAKAVTEADCELKREEGDVISLGSLMGAASSKSSITTQKAFDEDEDKDTRASTTKDVGGGASSSSAGQKRKLTAVEEIMLKEKRQKEEEALKKAKQQEEESQRCEHEDWLHRGIVVKVLNKKLADGKYYKQKGVVQMVHGKFVGEVKMNESGHVLKLDQEHLETVLPNFGGEVLVVNGKFRGQVGVLKALEEDKFSAVVRLEDGSTRNIPYEHVSKLA
ncbi:hypothetical protein GUITHDRAFT_159923 [Guillardia theta CCMP2712]|uniref:DNA/RNA-binding protein Kin17 WH-like domain-containing protein n=2 Tax=Guillardia theta TaxID=55529 RepID=L1IYU6_GUITC|nr:hypothetical protein GUITHDRAFT_159923 [Guillardia theta CCMP2712]EKX41000.1 hypothetical protein GUITHDRAFT_159923 [Guillardia theta CCMP2712]|eukprot:XP_005827980.1 hypothetical protein GUITHDRAFT_159923 [Guillardia theta CCMP2712]